MSDPDPKTSLRTALGTADLDPDDEVHYLAMLLGEAKRYDGAWDGDPEGAARWAVAQWCQEIGYVPSLAKFDAGEQVGKDETPPNCEAAFRPEGYESSIEPVVREIVEALYTADDAVVVRAKSARQAAEIYRQVVDRVPEEVLDVRVRPEVSDEEGPASGATYRLSLRRLMWDRDEGWFGEDTASGTHFDLTEDRTREMESLLRTFLAMERDRLLGYPGDELHRNPREVVREADELLQDRGYDPDDLILPEDRQRLDMEVEEDE